MPDTPAPILPDKRCKTCGVQTRYVYRFEKLDRCRECLKDALCHGARGARRQKLLRLLGPTDWAQGEFNWDGVQADGKGKTD